MTATYSQPAEYADLSPEEFRKFVEKAERNYRQTLGRMARDFNAAMIFGVTRQHFGPSGAQTFNSAAYVTPDGRFAGCYDKMHRGHVRRICSPGRPLSLAATAHAAGRQPQPG